MRAEHFDQMGKELGLRLVVWAQLNFDDAFGCKIERTFCLLYGGDSARLGDNPKICPGDRNSEKYIGKCRGTPH